MKNILIIGPPRAGKTTLAKMIVNNVACYNVINTDVIRDGIYEAFFEKVDQKERREIVTKAFPSFVKKIIDQYQKYYNPDTYYIIEGDILSIEDALSIRSEYDVEIICIGTPNISVDELFKRIRANALKYGCWTDEYSDDALLNLCKGYIEQSKKEEVIAKQNEWVYLDTSISNDCLLEYSKNLI